MKHKFSIFLLAFWVLVILLPTSKVLAVEFSITNVEISNITDGTAKLKWSTPWDQSHGTVYFGLDAENLDKSIGYNDKTYVHETYLTGLDSDETYYYKIVATNSQSQTIESYVRQFSTKNMADTRAPKIISTKVIQVIDKAAAISWEASEKVYATIYYGKFVDNDVPVKYSGSASLGYAQSGEKIFGGLTPSTEYQAKLIVKDKAKNEAVTYFKIKTETTSDSYKKLTIKNIKPSDTGSSEVSSTKVAISWQTNMISNGAVYWGTEPTKLKNKAIINGESRKLDHKITLIGLEPKTTYYFRIEAYNSFVSGSIKTEILSFATKSSESADNIIVDVNSSVQATDSDKDGLSDVYEAQIGTDANKSDSDKDGYADGLEVWNGYNPLGPGKLSAERYYKPRLIKTLEQQKAKELKNLLEDELGKLTLDAKYWPTYVSAYLYGDYPIEAIAQAIRFGGKTVHPTIGWEEWQNSDTYKAFITKEEPEITKKTNTEIEETSEATTKSPGITIKVL